MTASTELAADGPTVTPAHAHPPAHPNPFTEMSWLFGEASIAEVMDALVHGGPGAAVVSGATALDVLVVVGPADGDGEELHPNSASPPARTSAPAATDRRRPAPMAPRLSRSSGSLAARAGSVAGPTSGRAGAVTSAFRRSRRWVRRPGPAQRPLVNRVRVGRQQLSAGEAVCRSQPGRRTERRLGVGAGRL